MHNFPLAAFFLLLSFCANDLIAQSNPSSIESSSTNNRAINQVLSNSIIKSSSNGKLHYSYIVTNDYDYSVLVILKNDQSIYKQEIDTLKIRSQAAFTLLKQDLQNGLIAFQNVNTDFKVERSNYSLDIDDKGMTGFFMALSNPSGTVNTANTKFQIKIFLEWLNTIEFGKH